MIPVEARVLGDAALAGLRQTKPHRCQGLGVLIKPRFAFGNNAGKPDDDFISTFVLDNNRTVCEVSAKRHTALGVGAFVTGLSIGGHIISIMDCG